MQLVSTTIIALFAILVILRVGTVKGLWVFSALLPLGAAAAVNLPAAGGATIVLADAAAAALCGILLIERGVFGRLFFTMRPPSTGFVLILLMAFVAFATIYFPRLFAGDTEVFGLARLEGRIGIVARPLQPSAGNVTQILRFFIGVSVFLTLATAFRRAPNPDAIVKAMTALVVVHTILGFVDVATYQFGLAHWLDVIRTANYAMATSQVLGGLKRMVGGFPEASAFGYLTVGVFGFWLQYWFDKGRASYAGIMVLVIVVVLLLSASTSAYAAGGVFLVFFCLLNSRSFFNRQIDIRLALVGIFAWVAFIIISTALVVSYQTLPGIQEFFDRLIFEKLASNSGQERMSWNLQAYQNYLDTWTLGAGLGSVRASNWLIACLASLGTLGTILFVVFVASVFRQEYHGPDHETAVVFRALKMGCLAFLIRALIVKATPNLELAFFAMAGLVVGLSASAINERRSGQNQVMLHARQRAFQ